MLTTLTDLPDALLDCRAERLQDLLAGPTLIHLPGRRDPPLFVSILLHGNEQSGLIAIQRVLARDRGRPLPRALSLFVGNVAAAARGLRRLDGQPDYNRVWPGAETDDLPEHRMMRDVVDQMRSRGVFASIDIHNNTGLNPHYGCVTSLDPRALHLAALFARVAVWFRRPLGVQSMAFAALCPAVTLECGKSGDPSAAEHAAALVEAALHLDHFPAHGVAPGDLDLYHTVGIVRVPDSISFGFDRPGVDVAFDGAVERMNFRELEPGTRIARVRPGSRQPLEVRDEAGAPIADAFFEVVGDELRLRRRAVPAMLTLDERVIRQDCLCYLMDKHPLPAS